MSPLLLPFPPPGHQRLLCPENVEGSPFYPPWVNHKLQQRGKWSCRVRRRRRFEVQSEDRELPEGDTVRGPWRQCSHSIPHWNIWNLRYLCCVITEMDVPVLAPDFPSTVGPIPSLRLCLPEPELTQGSRAEILFLQSSYLQSRTSKFSLTPRKKYSRKMKSSEWWWVFNDVKHRCDTHELLLDLDDSACWMIVAAVP